jgi:hypothetical protein
VDARFGQKYSSSDPSTLTFAALLSEIAVLRDGVNLAHRAIALPFTKTFAERNCLGLQSVEQTAGTSMMLMALEWGAERFDPKLKSAELIEGELRSDSLRGQREKSTEKSIVNELFVYSGRPVLRARTQRHPTGLFPSPIQVAKLPQRNQIVVRSQQSRHVY